ncbi:MAG: RNA ligase family protein [Myxococcota bacterium]
MTDFRKYPRIPHLPGSARHGDDDQVPWASMQAFVGHRVVVTEKLDGANAGVSFVSGALQLQSRGHVLTGGARERHFALFKAWAAAQEAALYEALGERFVVYGEWLYARHTVFYDALPHYFVAFDVYDRSTDTFLASGPRSDRLSGLPLATPPIRFAGVLESPADLDDLPGRSACKSPDWQAGLRAATQEGEVAEWGDPERAIAQTDPSDEAEGFVVALEDEERVLERAKWVRPSFVLAMTLSGSHWLSRPILVNRLAMGASLW